MKLVKLPIYIHNAADECDNSSYVWINPSSVESIFIYQFMHEQLFVKLISTTGKEHRLGKFKTQKIARKFLDKMLKLLGNET